MSSKYCTHCGEPVLTRRGLAATELYDEDLFRKSNILKLLDCGACGMAADRYVECDGAQVIRLIRFDPLSTLGKFRFSIRAATFWLPING